MSAFERIYYETDQLWAGDRLMDDGNQARVRLAASMVPTDARSVFDAGCGNGVFGRALARVRPDVTLLGMDRSAAALNYVTFGKIQGSLDNIPFASGSFDCVTCLQVIEHLPLGIYEAALRELARVTRRYVLIGIPYREDLERETTTCPECRARFNWNLHLRSYDDFRIAELFAAHGGHLSRTEFPVRRRRLKYVNEVVSYLRRGSETRGFRSPICPICGYSEGGSPVQHETAEDFARLSQPKSGARKLAREVFRPLEKIWPREEVRGYWALCLYDFTLDG